MAERVSAYCVSNRIPIDAHQSDHAIVIIIISEFLIQSCPLKSEQIYVIVRGQIGG